MYYCNNCKNEFEEPINHYINAENYYGVDNLLNGITTKLICICPYCNSEEIEEMEKCDKCEEYVRYDDLIDTEEYINGGIGYICYDCAKDCDICD